MQAAHSHSLDISPLADIRAAKDALAEYVRETPVVDWISPGKDEWLPVETEVYIKLELLQHAGSFKPRGALTVMFSLDETALKKGVTAVSAGNHAIAVGYAAQVLGTTAKVVMPQTANPFRIKRVKQLGAELILTPDVNAAFQEVKRIQQEEGRTFVHPFEGKSTALGTATVGLEFLEQVPDLDAAIIPIGGGGLAAGMAMAMKQLKPDIELYGVEPTGADSMYRSFALGKPASIEAVRTIADSLGAPFALPYSYAICQAYLDQIVLVEDHQLRSAMRIMFAELKLAAEPAGAASLAALLGPLKDKLYGKKVGVIACGSNIDVESFFQLLGF